MLAPCNIWDKVLIEIHPVFYFLLIHGATKAVTAIDLV